MGSQRFFRNHLRAIHDALTLNQFCHQRLKSNFVVISVCRVLPVEILVQGLRQIHQKPECACSLALGGGHWHNGPNNHHFSHIAVEAHEAIDRMTNNGED